jgi:hypothetical protein
VQDVLVENAEHALQVAHAGVADHRSEGEAQGEVDARTQREDDEDEQPDLVLVECGAARGEGAPAKPLPHAVRL